MSQLPATRLLIAVCLFFTACSFTACNVAPDRDPAIGEAYAGPATLTLRKDLDLKSPPAAIVHHGDKLEIIAQRRRLYKVRTAKGLEGWTQDSGLLDTAQMNRLKALAKQTASLPSQGVATAFDTLRVHSEPNRASPSFLDVTTGEKVDVIIHKVTTRAAPPRRQLIAPRPKVEKKAKKEKAGVQPPPRPEPPGPPKDWVAISKQRTMAPDDDLPPAAHDDWTLIRTKTGQSGWVLTSRLYMAIPDEVAQYAEGHRITAYFSLGKIRDEERGENKDIWLWTTSESLGEDHDFDGYRVFVWSLRHHRYETAYIQRRERGFFPVIVKPGEFSVCLDGDSGRIRKRYNMLGNAVKLAGTDACEVSAKEDEVTGIPAHIEIRPQTVKKSLYERTKEKIKGIFSHK